MCVCVPVCALMCVSMVQKRSFSLPETTVYLCVCVCYMHTHTNTHTHLKAVSKKRSDVCVFHLTSLCIYTCASISPIYMPYSIIMRVYKVKCVCVSVCVCECVCV